MTDSTPSRAVPPTRRGRRVQRPGAPGSDPAPRLPEWEAAETAWPSNDEQLKRDVPPHY
ncbi:hypothetical protein [Leifsonia xyli]|uniref:hypothetical protein n=1 Tax=Leifsonia xyli TaxID=1575 RepID=UPI0012DDA1EE|nr:hypothetical protein [Leifsonia xyli]